MELSTILISLLGGVLLGLSSAALLLFNGKIAGISGIVGGLLRPVPEEWGWRAWYVGGLLAGGVLVYALHPSAFAIQVHRSLPLLIAAGLLVGFGARLGSGCTSGHGICGLSRFSARSWVATAVFTATGALAVFVLNHLGGGL
ncbi:MAG TPA: YeeE/YedE thiosulfate transporter family protein [bacterium]|nr:YeeE/YedE thiosulfate transporter family protein [bacterium]